jgi:transcriptional regulator with XRE-family HTH domain
MRTGDAPPTLWPMGVNRTTPKSRALGTALREAREAAGFSQRQFADRLGMSPGGLSLWESGKRTPPTAGVARALTLLGVEGDEFDRVVALTNDTEAPTWLAVSLQEQRTHLAALLQFERDASRIIAVSPLIVYGLLQTPAYVSAIMNGGSVPEDQIDTRIAIRLGRARILEDVSLTVILYEAALRGEVGGPATLLEQLRHLLDLGDRLDLRVIPFSAGWNPAMEGAWTMLLFEAKPTMVHMENRRSGLFLHEQDDVAVYHEATDAAMKVAMSPTQSRELVATVIKELESRI